MVKKTTPLNTLKNSGTSEVFFYICRSGGEIFPSDIAQGLDMPSSAVKAQLNRLEKAYLIYLAKTEGRYRHYFIDWKGLAELAIVKYKKGSILTHMTQCRGLKKKEKPSLAQVNSFFEKLAKTHFTDFLKAYFLKLAKNEKIAPDSVDYELDELERHIFRDYKENKGKTTLSKYFREWGAWLDNHEVDTFPIYKEVLENI
ncbi:helix-turn-helix transcriptional regulator [Candidatus Woesearchaeota archaeon]|nr:helix-turn-helix transcriptional regulator [Candidatus Woesearchaeota archaeon]